MNILLFRVLLKHEISDHYPILSQVNLTQTRKKADSTVTFYRDKSKFDSNQFNDELHSSLIKFFYPITLAN